MEATRIEAVDDQLRDYDADKELCKEFMREFISLDSNSDESFGSQSPAKYMQLLQGVANREVRVLDVSLDDIASFSSRESVVDMDEDDKIGELLRQIEKNTKRYVRVFSEAADELMPLPIPERMQGVDDVIDVLMRQV